MPDRSTDRSDRLLRGFPELQYGRARRAAAARGMTISAYLAALVDLHDAARARADAGDDALQAKLAALGLQTVIH